MKINLDDKTDVLTYHKKLLPEAVKEKEELKTKLENFQSSSKGLSKLLNSQMSTRDKFRLGYGNQIHDGVLNYENEVFHSVFDTRSSDLEDSPVHDRFANVEGMHAVPPPITGNYIPLGPDREVDDSIVETLKSVPGPVVVELKVENPSFAFVNTVKHVKTPRETVKEQNTCSPSPKADKRDRNGLMSKKLGLGYGFTRKACFVCGSFGHLIRDCDFHEKRMAKQVELNKQKGKGTGQRENRLVCNNVQRLNHQNNQAAATSTARKVNTARPIMNEIRPRNNFYKSHSSIRRPFNRTTTPKANFTNHKVNTAGDKTVSVVGGNRETVVKASASCNWRSKRHYWNKDDPQKALKNKGIIDSRCSRHMTGNKAYLIEYQDYNGGPVAFRGSKGQITCKGKIITGKLDFEDVYFVKELKQFNLFSVSQMCDKNNKFLFTDSECLVLSPDFKLPDENQVLLRVPRQNNMYSFHLENIVPTGGLACLIAKATVDESNKWHMRLGHVNFKNLNKLVKGNLVRCLPSKIFQNDHTCVACQKGKQHKASCKAKIASSISQPLQLLHMDLFGPTSVRSINHKSYCLVTTDDFSRCVMVQDTRTGTLLNSLFKMDQEEYSNSKEHYTKWIAEEKNRTLIEAARTMLADSFYLTHLGLKHYYIRPFGCHVTILNTIDHLGKFEENSNERFLVGYSLNCKAFRVYNLETKRVEENLHINFLENKPNVVGKGPNWPFDLDYLTDSMNYQPVTTENKANKIAGPKEANHNAGTQDNINAGNSEIEAEPAQEYFVLPLWSSYTSTVKSSEAKNGDEKPNEDTEKEANDATEVFRKEFAQCTKDLLLQAGAIRATSTNTVNTVSTPISTASPSNGAVADFTNLETTVNVSLIPTSRIHFIHPTTQILGDPTSAVQTRSKVNKSSRTHAFVNYIQKQRRNNHKDFQHCLFACFLSQIEPKKISQALEDES
ncbi:putative ribonuclease H-like domain-containing protein [Tanacetum coccineum]